VVESSLKNKIMVSMSNLAASDGKVMQAINIQNNKIPEVKITNV
jgi:hypothetical protein